MKLLWDNASVHCEYVLISLVDNKVDLAYSKENEGRPEAKLKTKRGRRVESEGDASQMPEEQEDMWQNID